MAASGEDRHWMTKLMEDRNNENPKYKLGSYETEEAYKVAVAIQNPRPVETIVYQSLQEGKFNVKKVIYDDDKRSNIVLKGSNTWQKYNLLKLVKSPGDAEKGKCTSYATDLYDELRTHLYATRAPHPHVSYIVPTIYLIGMKLAIEVEYFEKGPVSNRDRVQSVRKMMLLVRDAACGLAHLHGMGLVHVDVRPGNVCMKKDGTGKIRAKITNFASAQPAGTKVLQEKNIRLPNAFRAPELWMTPGVEQQVKCLDWTTDAWAFGMTALTMLQEETVFPWYRASVADEDYNGYAKQRAVLGRFKELPLEIETIGFYKNAMTQLGTKIVVGLLGLDPNKRPTMEKVVKEIEDEYKFTKE